jgi:acetylornithine/N-succinyldiaminopimelate aminotransferase
MLGLKLNVPAPTFIERLRANRMLVVGAAENAVRVLPPLIIDESHLKEAVAALAQTCASFEAERKAV